MTQPPVAPQIPAEQTVITLFDQPCLAVRDPQGAIFVAVVDLCLALGITSDSQLRRIRQHAIFRDGLVPFRVRRGNQIETILCLHLQLTAGWLMQIATNRTRPEVRDRLHYLQLHLLDTVWRAFAALGGLPDRVEQIEDVQDLDRIDQALHSFEVMMARQESLEQSQERARDAWRQMMDRLRDLSGRVADLEQRVASTLSPTQRGHLYHLVQAWATARAQRTTKMTREAVHAACWAEIKTRFGPVARYEDMRPSQYHEAVAYITQQYRQITGEDLILPTQDSLPL